MGPICTNKRPNKSEKRGWCGNVNKLNDNVKIALCQAIVMALKAVPGRLKQFRRFNDPKDKLETTKDVGRSVPSHTTYIVISLVNTP